IKEVVSSSVVKNIPPRGALKVADIPAAAPQETRVRSQAVGSFRNWPRVEPIAAPICTTGPARPTEPPLPMVRAEARVFTITVLGLIRPPRLVTANITSGTPYPRASEVP